jgi:hypothetical protein
MDEAMERLVSGIKENLQKHLTHVGGESELEFTETQKDTEETLKSIWGGFNFGV